MRYFGILLVAILCSGCSLPIFAIPKAPLIPNQAVVFDIDGTLTPKASAVFSVRDNAARAAQLYAVNGYKIIYLSARRRSLQFGIPGWLKKNNFPEGSIQVPQSSSEDSDHAAFKKRILKGFQENGWNLVAAYGDKSTDFEAYSAAGIDKDQVFALLRAGADSCQPGIWAKCLGSWTDHLEHITQVVRP